MSGGGRIYEGFVPGRHLIDAYGNGGFRFAEMSHRGSILALPSGVVAWPVTSMADLTAASLEPIFKEGPRTRVAALRDRARYRGVSRTACARAFAMRASAST